MLKFISNTCPFKKKSFLESVLSHHISHTCFPSHLKIGVFENGLAVKKGVWISGRSTNWIVQKEDVEVDV